MASLIKPRVDNNPLGALVIPESGDVNYKLLDAAGLNALLAKIKGMKDTLEARDETLRDGIASADKTVVVNADSDNLAVDLSVNVDGKTIVKNATSGEISSAVKIAKITASAENVLDEYQLQDKDGAALVGETIKVYKDSSIADVHVGDNAVDEVLWDAAANEGNGANAATGNKENDQKLYIKYVLANGQEKTVAIDFQKFIEEAEIGDGLEVNSAVVSVKVAADSEEYLTVDENGVKVAGIDAIKDRVKAIEDAPYVVKGAIEDSEVADYTSQDLETLWDAEKAIKDLDKKAGSDKQDIIDTLNDTLTAAEVEAMWDAAMA